MVIFAHATHTINFPPWLVKRPSAFIVGSLGVRVFFVISGYLITTLLIKEANRTGRISLAEFYRRRAFRILPVFYFYILTVFVIVGWMGLNAMHCSTFLSALTFTTHLWGSWSNESWPLMHSWSLAIEEQFYLIWPLTLALLGPRLGEKLWVPLLIVTAPVLRWLLWDKNVIEQLFLTQGDSIAFGCLLALVFMRKEPQTLRFFEFHPHLARIGAVVLIYLQPILIISFPHLRSHLPQLDRLFVTFLPTTQCLGIIYLIGSLVTVQEGLSYKFLNFGLVQWIGRLSYSLYIWQQLILIPKEVLVFPRNWTTISWLTTFPQNIAIVFVLAVLSYYCLEQPFLSLKNKSEKLRQQTKRGALAAPIVRSHS